MRRGWIATALLTASLLFGFGYFEPAQAAWSFFLLMAGTLVMGWSFLSLPDGETGKREPTENNDGQGRLWLALAILGGVAAAWAMPWPFRAGPLLLGLGAGLVLYCRATGQRQTGFALGCAAAGAVLLAQSLGLLAYIGHTIKSHELPSLFAWPVCGLMQLTGLDVTYTNDAFALRDGGQLHNMAAAWELLFDPATFLFIVGTIVFTGVLTMETIPAGGRLKSWGRSVGVIGLIYILWAPLRAVLMVHLYLHRSLLEQPTLHPGAMDQFVSDWLGAALLAVPVVLLALLVKRPSLATAAEEDEQTAGEDPDNEKSETASEQAAPISPSLSKPAIALGCFLLGAVLLTIAVQWHPVGDRKEGRVTVVERHSEWEPTTRPYSMDFYEEAGSYNYAAAYDYLSQYYTMSRILESQEITRESLANTDVLVIKTPTAPYQPSEITAIRRFVGGGGSLLLIGDHTSVFDTGAYLNDIARPMGFTFRHDLLFHVDSAYIQEHDPPSMPHPAVQNVPPMNYAVSCSIDPSHSIGSPVVWDTCLWNLPPDYNADNYHPQAEYHPTMRYGAFCQVWSQTYGKGRVLAFTDSTIFSNFCVYQPGKVELLREMIQWLNRTSPFDQLGLWLALITALVSVGIALLVAGLWLVRKNAVGWIPVIAAVLLGWAVTASLLEAVQRRAMPVPDIVNPISQVVIDRTICDGPLSLGAYVEDETGNGYGLLEQWIPRISYVPRADASPLDTTSVNAADPAAERARYCNSPRYFTTRASGADVFSEKTTAIVFIHPSKSVPVEYLDGLIEFVRDGGHVLVIDSPSNTTSTANSLLIPFGLTMGGSSIPDGLASGRLMLDETGPGFEVESARTVISDDQAQSLALVDRWQVGAKVAFGKGSVTAIGFGDQFNDASMGWTWLEMPEEQQQRKDLLTRYDTLYSILLMALADSPPEGAVFTQQPSQEEPPDGETNSEQSTDGDPGDGDTEDAE